eukprot:m.253054 g.253054  ORF g.253054 m.253054 type:complete len:101 (+) comp33905_c0_seq15:3694-3996(+)
MIVTSGVDRKQDGEIAVMVGIDSYCDISNRPVSPCNQRLNSHLETTPTLSIAHMYFPVFKDWLDTRVLALTNNAIDNATANMLIETSDDSTKVFVPVMLF